MADVINPIPAAVPGVSPSAAPDTPKKKHPLARLAMTLVKIAIAVLGIWWVAHKTHWYDTATVPAGTVIRNITVSGDTAVRVLRSQAISPPGVSPAKITYSVEFPRTLEVTAETPAGTQPAKITDQNRDAFNFPRTLDLPAEDFRAERGAIVTQGLASIASAASSRWYLLVLAWLLLVTPFFVTAIRWRNLMRPQGIEMPLGKCLELTFVGQFYSILLPGITGGDLVKIVYAGRLTGSNTKAFITIILDRVIGLVVLMAIAGASAGIQVLINRRNGAPADNTLFNVFILIVILLAGLGAGFTVYFSRRLRRGFGIEWFLDHAGELSSAPESPDHESTQHQKLERLFRLANVCLLAAGVLAAGLLALLRWGMAIGWAVNNTPAIIVGVAIAGAVALGAIMALILHARLVNRITPLLRKIVGTIVGIDETLHVYRGHFGLLAWAFAVSLISQLALPVSAWLSGMAFGMQAPVSHYLAYVPIAILAASLPISPPQGFGILDWLLVHFFAAGTDTAAQAVTLAQSVRFFPILWNLCGAWWVVTGQYSRAKISPAE